MLGKISWFPPGFSTEPLPNTREGLSPGPWCYASLQLTFRVCEETCHSGSLRKPGIQGMCGDQAFRVCEETRPSRSLRKPVIQDLWGNQAFKVRAETRHSGSLRKLRNQRLCGNQALRVCEETRHSESALGNEGFPEGSTLTWYSDCSKPVPEGAPEGPILGFLLAGAWSWPCWSAPPTAPPPARVVPLVWAELCWDAACWATVCCWFCPWVWPAVCWCCWVWFCTRKPQSNSVTTPASSRKCVFRMWKDFLPPSLLV